MENREEYVSPDAVVVDSTIGGNVRVYKCAEVKKSQLGSYTSIGDQSIILESRFEGNIAINRRNFIQQSSIGRFTYTGPNTMIRAVEVGKFCSISWNVSLGGKNHHYDRVTNSTEWAFHNLCGAKPKGRFDYGAGHQPCVIGNDVWVAANVVVLRGVKVGNGAVIGAGAIVTKDVEPYSIIAGVPAKPIKKRFDEDTIAELEKIKWWNWPVEVIRQNLERIYSSTVNADVLRKMMEISEWVEAV